QTLPLRRSRTTPNSSRKLRRRLQLRPPPQDTEGANALRVHLQTMDFRARTIHHRSNPPNPGTKHLLPTAAQNSPPPCGEGLGVGVCLQPKFFPANAPQRPLAFASAREKAVAKLSRSSGFRKPPMVTAWPCASTAMRVMPISVWRATAKRAQNG